MARNTRHDGPFVICTIHFKACFTHADLAAKSMQRFCRTLLSSACSLCAVLFFATTHLSRCNLDDFTLGSCNPRLFTKWSNSFTLIRAVMSSLVKVSEDLRTRLDSRSRPSISEMTSFRSSLSLDNEISSRGAFLTDLTISARFPDTESNTRCQPHGFHDGR